MIPKTTYKCEYCGFEGSRDECERHEAAHFGITTEEYRHWQKLKQDVRQASYRAGTTKNQETDAAFDKAIDELTDFEIKHGIKNN